MGGMFVKSQSVFSFHLNGESSVDADVVINAIQNMSIITSEIAKEEDPLLLSRLQVKPFKNGSFEIVFITIAELGLSIISNPDTAATIATKIVHTLFKCFEIKKALKGEPPKSVTNIKGDQVKIENRDGQIIYAPSASTIVLNNSAVGNAVSNIATYAMKNNPNEGFSLLGESQDLKLSFSPDDIKNIAKSDPIEKVYTAKCTRSTELLLIKSLNLIGNSKWSFIYKRKTILASINDEDWLDNVQNGTINIRAKDSIRATLETTVELDSGGFPIPGTEKYSIIHVLDLISGDEHNANTSPKQLKMFED